MDVIGRSTRSRMMAAVRSRNTGPEIQIRLRLFRLGFRYRLHGPSLPGKPDLIFPRYRAVVFINGCFWHNHDCPHGALPMTRQEWWRAKLQGNRARDAAVLRELALRGWRTLVIWECSFRTARKNRGRAFDAVADRVARFLRSESRHAVLSGSPVITDDHSAFDKVILDDNHR
jgi:DNA mismatch endonuclease (patch repair protein)